MSDPQLPQTRRAHPGLVARVFCLVLAVGCLAGTATAAERGETAALWQRLAQGKAVALMRHASAPGFSDPPDFSVDDCSTQRNLSEAGRAEARTIGASIRAHGIDNAAVRSSQWCRCLDTARLLGFGPVVPTPALNSFFEQRDRADAQTRAARALLADTTVSGARIWVTHQVNISALTGLTTRPGEIVVVAPRDGDIEVLGRLAPLDD